MIDESKQWEYDRGYAKGKADVLDKIRAEIDKLRFVDKDTRLCRNANASGLEVALQIIDKYRGDADEND